MIVVESGMGADAARDAVGWALATFAPARVVSAGFCGALCEELPVGAVLLPDEVIDEAGSVRAATVRERCFDPPSLTVAVRTGRLLSACRPVATPAQRLALRQRYGAVAVDLESATVVAACRSAGVTCCCVRAVSDGCHDELSPGLLRALRGPWVDWRRLALAAVRRPGVVAELWRLARQSRRATSNLADALQQLLDVPGGGR